MTPYSPRERRSYVFEAKAVPEEFFTHVCRSS